MSLHLSDTGLERRVFVVERVRLVLNFTVCGDVGASKGRAVLVDQIVRAEKLPGFPLSLHDVEHEMDQHGAVALTWGIAHDLLILVVETTCFTGAINGLLLEDNNVAWIDVDA